MARDNLGPCTCACNKLAPEADDLATDTYMHMSVYRIDLSRLHVCDVFRVGFLLTVQNHPGNYNNPKFRHPIKV